MDFKEVRSYEREEINCVSGKKERKRVILYSSSFTSELGQLIELALHFKRADLFKLPLRGMLTVKNNL